MRLCEHLRASSVSWSPDGKAPASRRDNVSDPDGDVFDDYHDWLEESGSADYRLEDSQPTQGRFPYPAEMHPTSWIERETRSLLAAHDPPASAVSRSVVPASTRPVRPTGAVRVDV